jgi:hypothetical protein
VLEGTLESFTLPDIFQLLSLTKKTGCLRLDHGAQQGRVYFEDGQVYYAMSSSGRLALGRRLVGAGLLDTSQLRAALAEQAQLREDGRGLRIGRILVEAGVISADTLETFVREQVQDAVFDLMRWSDGSFSFDTTSPDAKVTEPIQLAVSVENLIMEGSRRLEEWEQVRRKVPSLHAIVAMAPMPGDGVEVSLEPAEWRLLTVVDGRRTVGDLVDIFGQGEFQTCKVLYGMVGAGLLEVRDPGAEGPHSVAAILEQHELLDRLEDARESVPGPPEATGEAGDAVAEVDDAAPADPEPAGPDELSLELDEELAGEPEQDEPLVSEDAPADDAPAPATEEDDPVPDATEWDDDPGTRQVAEPVAHTTEESPAESGQRRLTTDPSIDADLVRRLIAGVEGL